MTCTRSPLLVAAVAALALEGCSGTDITGVNANGHPSSTVGGAMNGGESGETTGATSATASQATGGVGPTSTSAGGTSNLDSSQPLETGGVVAMGGARSSGGTRAFGGMRASGGVAATGGVPLTGGTSSLSTGAHSNPLSQALIDEFVSAHNAARSGTLDPPPSPALPPVTWDYTLADSAYNYLSKCPGGNVDLAPHNANRAADYKALGGTDSVGENIYASTGSTVTPSAAMKSWMSEASTYDYDTNNISAAGHYTQIVWRTSVRIGCAIVNCPNYRYSNTILCDYAPAGNNTRQKPY